MDKFWKEFFDEFSKYGRMIAMLSAFFFMAIVLKGCDLIEKIK